MAKKVICAECKHYIHAGGNGINKDPQFHSRCRAFPNKEARCHITGDERYLEKDGEGIHCYTTGRYDRCIRHNRNGRCRRFVGTE